VCGFAMNAPGQPASTVKCGRVARLEGVRCGATADICEQRFGCTSEEAQRVEKKLPTSNRNTVDFDRKNGRCDALQARLGLSEAELRKVVVRLPAVLGCSYEANVEPSLAKLQARLGLSEAELRKVVVTLPSVLGYNYEANLAPKLDFLQVELNVSLEVLREQVLAVPARLGYSLAKRYQPRLKACQCVAADPMMVLSRIKMTDERFRASIGVLLTDL